MESNSVTSDQSLIKCEGLTDIDAQTKKTRDERKIFHDRAVRIATNTRRYSEKKPTLFNIVYMARSATIVGHKLTSPKSHLSEPLQDILDHLGIDLSAILLDLVQVHKGGFIPATSVVRDRDGEPNVDASPVFANAKSLSGEEMRVDEGVLKQHQFQDIAVPSSTQECFMFEPVVADAAAAMR